MNHTQKTDFDRILIGGREKRTIVMVEYDERWPARFERKRDQVVAAILGRAGMGA